MGPESLSNVQPFHAKAPPWTDGIEIKADVFDPSEEGARWVLQPNSMEAALDATDEVDMETDVIATLSATTISSPSNELVEVASEAQLMDRNGRLLVQRGGRHLALIAHCGELHAIDATCYHMGGPLLHADIEDYGAFGPCVVCPWHRYPISLRSGECLYRNMSGTMCSKGLKQRVHEVVQADGRIFVRLASTEDKVESDTYAFKTPPPSGGGMQAPPQRRSGEVLRAGAAGWRGSSATAGTAGDVSKSMGGADGRAPWA